MPQEEWPTHQAQRDIINSDFDKSTPYGDRRQVHTVPAMTNSLVRVTIFCAVCSASPQGSDSCWVPCMPFLLFQG